MWTSLKLKTSGDSLREATTLPWVLPPEVLLGSHDEDQRKIPPTLAMVRGKVTILTYTQGKSTYFWNVPRAFSRTKAYPALLQCEPDHHQHGTHHRQLPTQAMAWLELCIRKMLLALLFMKRRDRFLSRDYDNWPGKKMKGQCTEFNEWGRSQESLANDWMFIVHRWNDKGGEQKKKKEPTTAKRF